MDTQHLEEIFPALLRRLESEGYSSGYISKVKVEFNWIVRHAEGNTWQSYQDIYLERAASTESEHTRKDRRKALAALERADLGDGRLSLERRSDAYSKLSPAYKALVDCFREHEGKRDKAAQTVEKEAGYLSSFLCSMQERGCMSMVEVTEEDVLSFFCDDSGKPSRSSGYARKTSNALKAAAASDPECMWVSHLVPIPREKRKNIQYLTCEETAQVKAVLECEDSGLSLRDRAIGKLVLFTGMRASDVASMRLDSIDWEGEKISLVQEKTEAPLEIPLRPVVGNAIYDYLTGERSDSGEPWLFLSTRRPYGKLNKRTISKDVIGKIFAKAGIRQAEGDRKGTHIFRHRAATTMLGSGVARPIVSEVVGHTHPGSLDPYLHADFVHLKECALSIERFAVPEEVFAV